MLDERLMECFPFDEIYDIHNMQDLPVGVFESVRERSCRPRTISKSPLPVPEDMPLVPMQATLFLVAACVLVMNLQTILSRRPSPADTSWCRLRNSSPMASGNALPGNRIPFVASGKSSSTVNRQPSGLSRPAAPHQLSGLAVTINEDMPLVNVMPRVIWAKH
ncbi:hypothetical protein [Mesorhizobium sp. WSM2239]|uniref:Uncharacterized protein n=2 Tax=unclassified Mesorhizobium TaxID=325217 RepID=A0AAU8DFF9_9HYPH